MGDDILDKRKYLFYADRGYGVCLVFDKDKLNLASGDYATDVNYANFIPQAVMIHN